LLGFLGFWNLKKMGWKSVLEKCFKKCVKKRREVQNVSKNRPEMGTKNIFFQ